MKPSTARIKPTKPALFIDFTKASPQVIEAVLEALNAEVEEALAEKRFPFLEKAMERLGRFGSWAH
jgi:hypothetical protein